MRRIFYFFSFVLLSSLIYSCSDSGSGDLPSGYGGGQYYVTEGGGSFDKSCQVDVGLCSVGKCNEAAVWLDSMPLNKPSFATDDNVVYAHGSSVSGYEEVTVFIRTVSFEEFKNYVLDVQKTSDFSVYNSDLTNLNGNTAVGYTDLNKLLETEPNSVSIVLDKSDNNQGGLRLEYFSDDYKEIVCGVSKSSMHIAYYSLGNIY